MADTRKQSLLEELKFLPEADPSKSSASGKKKLKKRRDSKIIQKKKVDTKEQEDNPAISVGEDFEYKWPTCACGMNHPPIPSFSPPDGIRCSYYWQIADRFPYIGLYRTLTTEIKFIQADQDQSGLIEQPELKTLLRDVFGTEIISDKMLERTFKEVDLDKSGTIDFFEVLTILFRLVQRTPTNLPQTVQKEYSKVCSIQ
ncbi:uncharacterized protein LOC123533212 [Mercenaria mercenaria]|uniref:uncharacterized protein LOC123533212 n=1 Tax=Mercenaria mercenaria TaxID=6596 RepID=UPI001E1DE50A|nr:uncharacterized protein LOC123533212 [Mercenaria mercenaria]XP_045170792.1 uncharacterized protein LOC123533212 [Mercenaria mercenaria]XP_045170798.1 uncharacterized protein LOC123533212 [Mercenaria mercenaria]